MTYTADHKNLTSYIGYGPPRRNTVVKGSRHLAARLCRSFLKLCISSRCRQTQRDIANYVASRGGGRMTDDLEREITRRLLTSDWSPRER